MEEKVNEELRRAVQQTIPIFYVCGESVPYVYYHVRFNGTVRNQHLPRADSLTEG